MNFLLASAATAQAEPASGAGLMDVLMTFLPMITIFLVFWVILILPQRKQQKKRDEMLNALKKGDKVVTIGGIHGEITQINGDDILLRVTDKVELKMLRSAVSRVKGE
jgi:preprotein translocase subunit YajC